MLLRASRRPYLSTRTSLPVCVWSTVDVPMVIVVRFPLVCRLSH